MTILNIAGMFIDIDSKDEFDLKGYQSFISATEERPNLKIKLKSNKHISRPEGDIIINEDIKWLRNANSNEYPFVCINETSKNKIVSILKINSTCNIAEITYLKNEWHNIDMDKYIKPLTEILFRNSIIHNKGIVAHASAVEWEGRGIMFSAPSETGKSTQAKLWQDYMGAKILNDDRPAIKVVGERSYIYGTPWSGTSTKNYNGSAPLAAIVILNQSPTNSIRQLMKHEAVEKLMPRCFLPYFDSSLMDMAINTLEEIIDKTPIYLLKCRPDQEAVKLVYECVR